MENLAVFIKTCPGRPALLWSINSIRVALSHVPYRLYISDEQPLDDWKESLYETLKHQGHFVEVLSSKTPVGVARNRLVKELKDESLVLRLDDDFELGGEFDIDAMIAVLDSSSQIGFCSDRERQIGHGKGVRSGAIRPDGGRIVFGKSGEVVKRFYPPCLRYSKIKGTRYKLADFTRNLLLIRRDVCENVGWNENLHFSGEHLDFMLAVKEAGYLGAFTVDSTHYHRDDLAKYRSQGENGGRSECAKEESYRSAAVYEERWGARYIRTSYPMSWYVYEGLRRISTLFG